MFEGFKASEFFVFRLFSVRRRVQDSGCDIGAEFSVEGFSIQCLALRITVPVEVGPDMHFWCEIQHFHRSEKGPQREHLDECIHACGIAA